MRSVWQADFKKFAPGLRVSVAPAHERGVAFSEVADVYITNHDAVKWLALQKPAFFKNFGELIVDESTAFKHHTSKRSKAVAKIAKYFNRRTLMTGTPNTLSITDVWHQAFILDGGVRLGPSYYSFRNSVCQPGQVGRSEHAIKWRDRDGAEEAVFNQLDDIVIRHKLDDCADIPPNHHYTLPYTHSPKQQKAFDDMQQTQIMLLDSAAKQPTSVIAVNAAAVATKLLQIASGAVYTSPDVYTVIDPSRYELVMDLVEQRKHPLVFFLWKHQRDLLVKEAESRKLKYAVIDGTTSDDKRRQIEQGYQAGLYDVLIGHPKTVAHGFTFTKGTSTIWTSPTQNLEWYDQGSRRQRRLGQTEKTQTITVLANNDVEHAVYADLQEKNSRMNNLLSLFETLKQKYT